MQLPTDPNHSAGCKSVSLFWQSYTWDPTFSWPQTQPSVQSHFKAGKDRCVCVRACVCTKLKSDDFYFFSFLLRAFLRYLCIMVVIKSSYLLVSPPGPLFRNGQTLNYSNPSMLIYLMLDAWNKIWRRQFSCVAFNDSLLTEQHSFPGSRQTKI